MKGILPQLVAFLQARPNVWIDGRELATVGGAYAWRTRVSDARRLGLRIDNRQRRVGRAVVSEYRFVPASPPADQLPGSSAAA